MGLKSTADDFILQRKRWFDIFCGNCRTVFEKISVSTHRKPKKCHYDSEGVQDYLPRKGGNGAYGKSQELIGILQVQFRKTGHSLYSGIPCFHQMMLNCLLYVNYS